MKNKYEVSIIIPIYNVDNYLGRCLDSVLSQTYTDFEAILVDDGSTDQSGAICDEYAQKDSRFRVIHQKNDGQSAARNMGINNAHGSFLCFVDSDDWLHQDYIQQLYRAIIENQADVAMCNFEYVYEPDYSGNVDAGLHSPMKDELLNAGQAMDKLFLEYPWYYVVAWNKLYRKEMFQSIRYPEGMTHEDEFVIHNLFHQCSKIVTIKQTLYYYRQRNDSIMGQRQRQPLSKSSFDGLSAFIDRAVFLEKKNYLQCAKQCQYACWCRYIQLKKEVKTHAGYDQEFRKLKRSMRKLAHQLTIHYGSTPKEKLKIFAEIYCPTITHR